MENSGLEVFNLIMSGRLKEGLDLASKSLNRYSVSFQQLIQNYSQNPKMTDEQLRKLYKQLSDSGLVSLELRLNKYPESIW